MKNLLKRKLRVLAVAVSSSHLHIIVELPDDLDVIARTVGWCKWHATRAMGGKTKLQVWAEGETRKPIDADKHLKAAYEYVWFKQGPTAWAWSFREGERDATR